MTAIVLFLGELFQGHNKVKRSQNRGLVLTITGFFSSNEVCKLFIAQNINYML